MNMEERSLPADNSATKIAELQKENEFLKNKIDELLGLLEDCLKANEEVK